MNYKQKLRAITTFIFDVDGVLTDGKVYLMRDEVVRALNSKDGYSLQYASKMNYKLFIITGGYSEDLKKRLLDLGIKDVFLRSSNKLVVYNKLKEDYGFQDAEVLYMGDDIPDIPVLRMAGVSCCPQDAAIDVKEIVDYHSPIEGGKGCVRDVIEQTLRVQGNWLKESAFHW
ncbi:MAG: HAD hydrolase-like protein [Crocinitomicaceae bacterium]|jgi:3-deoxy-D-manno-octulosonate 8-phosphate phosphatase (KDO 8-P phosphatase)|tara:strand:+ start:131 stop:646 length:516 start_codon:yes stop_codon:yes gene_type:complete